MEHASTEPPAPTDAKVIDLTRPAATTSVRVERGDNAFGHLTEQERMRLIIRVLCELVAFDAVDEVVAPHAAAS